MQSLKYLLDKPVRYELDNPVSYEVASDVFCLDLYKDFDLDRLVAIAAPTVVIGRSPVETTTQPDQDYR
jgi:hypothetical protein